MKKIIFTGGGTVGHVTLNLLLIPKLQIEDIDKETLKIPNDIVNT